MHLIHCTTACPRRNKNFNWTTLDTQLYILFSLCPNDSVSNLQYGSCVLFLSCPSLFARCVWFEHKNAYSLPLEKRLKWDKGRLGVLMHGLNIGRSLTWTSGLDQTGQQAYDWTALDRFSVLTCIGAFHRCRFQNQDYHYILANKMRNLSLKGGLTWPGNQEKIGEMSWKSNFYHPVSIVTGLI